MTAQRIALTLSTQILPLCLALSSIGCSGGVNDALSLPDGSASLDNVSINAGADAIKKVPTPPESATPASGNDAVTGRAFSTCPTEVMSPVDMTKAACLVGRYQGALYDNAQNKFGDKPCKVALLADGRLTLSVDGVAERTHQFSHHPYAENASAASAYVFLNPGSTDFSPETSEAYPLTSKVAGPSSMQMPTNCIYGRRPTTSAAVCSFG